MYDYHKVHIMKSCLFEFKSRAFYADRNLYTAEASPITHHATKSEPRPLRLNKRLNSSRILWKRPILRGETSAEFEIFRICLSKVVLSDTVYC